jgi:hypothetical protein
MSFFMTLGGRPGSKLAFNECVQLTNSMNYKSENVVELKLYTKLCNIRYKYLIGKRNIL